MVRGGEGIVALGETILELCKNQQRLSCLGRRHVPRLGRFLHAEQLQSEYNRTWRIAVGPMQVKTSREDSLSGDHFKSPHDRLYAALARAPSLQSFLPHFANPNSPMQRCYHEQGPLGDRFCFVSNVLLRLYEH